MSIPAYLDSTVYPFAYTELTGLTDVETGGVGIISSMRSMLVTTLGWTEPSTALFKTPVDGAGRFLDVLVTRITSTTIEWRVRNQAAVTVCTRRFNLGTGGLRLYGSTAGILAEFIQTSQSSLHLGSAFLLDMAPDLTTDHTLYVVGNGFLNNAGTNDSAGDVVGEYFAIDNGTATSANRMNAWQSTNGTIPVVYSAGMRAIFREHNVAINFLGTLKWAGRVVHGLLCDGGFSGGDERKVYIDTNTIATFKCIGIGLGGFGQRLMMRKS